MAMKIKYGGEKRGNADYKLEARQVMLLRFSGVLGNLIKSFGFVL